MLLLSFAQRAGHTGRWPKGIQQEVVHQFLNKIVKGTLSGNVLRAVRVVRRLLLADSQDQEGSEAAKFTLISGTPAMIQMSTRPDSTNQHAGTT